MINMSIKELSRRLSIPEETLREKLLDDALHILAWNLYDSLIHQVNKPTVPDLRRYINSTLKKYDLVLQERDNSETDYVKNLAKEYHQFFPHLLNRMDSEYTETYINNWLEANNLTIRRKES